MRKAIIVLLAAGAIAASATLALAGTSTHARHASSRQTSCGLLSENAMLKVLAPKPMEVVKGPFLNLQVMAQGYTLNDYYAGSPALACVGHYHEILDGMLVDMTPLQGPNVDQISMVGVSRGMHVLTLIPARNDHTMLLPLASIPFDYQGPYRPEPAGYSGTGKPSITIVSPKPGATIGPKSFTMTVSVKNFVLCQNCYAKALVTGEGHWHVFEDAATMPNMRQMAGSPTVTVPLANHGRGWHMFYAVLVDNHHMPLMPMVMTSERLFVK